MTDEPRALARVVTSAISRRPSTTFAAAALCGVGALALFLTGWPLLSLCAIAVITLASLGVAMRESLVIPDAIASLELRTAYLGVRTSLDEVICAALRAPGLQAAIEPTVARCHDTAKLAGRLALLANPIQAYLDAHSSLTNRADMERLQHLLEHATPACAKVLARAGEVRVHEVALRERLVERQAQIVAKLELARAILDEATARIVELGATEAELTAPLDTADLDGITDDLRSLASGFAVTHSA